MELTQSIQINHPCPVPLTKLKSDGNNFYCKGCSKSVIDFRGKSIDEIRIRCASGNVCGVFNPNQLTNQHSYRGLNAFLFKTLTILALIGFNVSPLKAQLDNSRVKSIKKLSKDVVEGIKKNNSKPLQEAQVIDKRKAKMTQRKKKKNFTITGCPSF